MWYVKNVYIGVSMLTKIRRIRCQLYLSKAGGKNEMKIRRIFLDFTEFSRLNCNGI